MNIFVIGSCFAVEIRKVLLKKELNLFPLEKENSFIYYNAPNILLEFERPKELNNTYYQNTDGMFQNPFRRMARYRTLDRAIFHTERLNKLFEKWINEADIFIITLGMSEVFEAENGYIMSNHPQYALLKTRSNVPATFKLLSKEDNYRAIKRIAEIAYPRPIIFTVSPIPLERTFRKIPLEQANSESKQNLLDAVQMLLFDKMDNVYYYDSYEYATELNKKENIYKEDKRHVKEEVVENIVNRFLNTIWKNIFN